jgi:hypothetical protein
MLLCQNVLKVKGMVRIGGKREKQHYVPQLLLRNFAINPLTDRGGKQIYVLDKLNSKVFTANVRDIAAAYEFYQVETETSRLDAEGVLSELEARASAALSRLITLRSVAGLTAEERQWLAIFTSVQFMRTQTVRGRLDEINVEIEEHIRKMGYDPDKVEGFKRMKPDDVKTTTIRMLARSLTEYPPHFLAKQCFLMETDESNPFHIGDHPVTMTNDHNTGPYGNLGIAVPGIQIYMPISPSLTLAFWCPSIVRKIERDWVEPRKMLAQLKELQAAGKVDGPNASTQIAQIEAGMAMSDRVVSAVAAGGIVPSVTDNTDMLNSLQVKFATRFVMSKHHDFRVAERMFADNDGYRTRRLEGIKIN